MWRVIIEKTAISIIHVKPYHAFSGTAVSTATVRAEETGSPGDGGNRSPWALEISSPVMNLGTGMLKMGRDGRRKSLISAPARSADGVIRS